jgi:hypothetical protein
MKKIAGERERGERNRGERREAKAEKERKW